jgi:glycogen debranching enzyme
MGIEDIRDALIIREGPIFYLSDRRGNAPAGNNQGYGVYHADTRHLSAYTLTLNGTLPVMLLSTAELGFAMEQVMTNPTMSDALGRVIERGSVEIRRLRVIADVVEETLSITNFNPFPVVLNLLYEFGADFADIFDVRGYRREHVGTMAEFSVTERAIEYGYRGVDDRFRSTTVEFDREPDYCDASTALFRVKLPHREVSTLRIEINPQSTDAPRIARPRRITAVIEDYGRWMDAGTEITTDNTFLNRVLTRSLQDVRMLWSTTHDGAGYPAAGTPWFDALFGRDSCILSMQMLAYQPNIARSCLTLLAKWQGSRYDHARDEEPGKILHELRFDELTAAGELPYGPYYGSVDSTPLFVWLAGEYFGWTGDVEFIRSLLPSIERALGWMRDSGDAKGDGFLSYAKHSSRGLVNQGWKDSWDAIVHADGSLASAPVALVEAQGYAYAAMTRIAPALERIGAHELAKELRHDAHALRRRFNERFWMEEQRFYAMAIDGPGELVESAGSNPGHALWAGIIDPARGRDVADRLMSPELFSGWGIRTLSEENPRYNPIGYHVGTVWPHDNSIAAFGLKMYGFEPQLNVLASALFDAATAFEYFRLPELFGGQRRGDHGPPVPYPVACRPQSWAAGAMPLIMQAVLGLRANAPEGRLRIVNPQLPQWLNNVDVRRLRVGEAEISLHYRRDGDQTRVEVLEATSGIDVVIGKTWRFTEG